MTTEELPKFATEATILLPKEFKIRVAVDFGTDGIGTMITYKHKLQMVN